MAKAQKPLSIDQARGKRIAALRRQIGDSQAAFGDRFEVEQATVSRWEEGKPVKPALWPRLAELAGKTVDEFIHGRPGGERVPLISWASASDFRDTGDIPPDVPTIEVPPGGLPAGDWFALKVLGDSMDRIAPDGAIIYVNGRDRILLPDQFYVFHSTEGATFKRYATNPKRLEPFSTNPVHRTIFPKGEVRVIGRVRRVVTDLF